MYGRWKTVHLITYPQEGDKIEKYPGCTVLGMHCLFVIYARPSKCLLVTEVITESVLQLFDIFCTDKKDLNIIYTDWPLLRHRIS